MIGETRGHAPDATRHDARKRLPSRSSAVGTAFSMSGTSSGAPIAREDRFVSTIVRASPSPARDERDCPVRRKVRRDCAHHAATRSMKRTSRKGQLSPLHHGGYGRWVIKKEEVWGGLMLVVVWMCFCVVRDPAGGYVPVFCFFPRSGSGSLLYSETIEGRTLTTFLH